MRVSREPKGPVRAYETHRQAHYNTCCKNTQVELLPLLLAYLLTALR